jgi:hypothetical protein
MRKKIHNPCKTPEQMREQSLLNNKAIPAAFAEFVKRFDKSMSAPAKKMMKEARVRVLESLIARNALNLKHGRMKGGVAQ